MTQIAAPETRRSRARKRPRRRTSFLGVIGELLITAGVVALLFVAWQMWIGDMIIGAQQRDLAHSISDQWQQDYEAAQGASPAPTESAGAPVTAPPPVMPDAEDADIFATMHIPRLASDYAVPMVGGVSTTRSLNVGIGHYPGTSMPGALGNVALAGHRGSNGGPFHLIADLHIGDAIVIETADGWYTYRFRNFEYVTPQSVDVLAPVPQQLGVQADGSYLTMTSCSPIDGSAERIIAYSSFESFTPRSAGAPASLTGGVA